MTWHIKRFIHIGALLAAIMLTAASAYAQDERLVVKEIVVNFDGPAGEKARAISTVRRHLNIRAGSPFNQAVLDENVRKLCARGPYEVSSWIEYGRGGAVRVIIHVRKQMYVYTVEFKPEPPALDSEELLELITTSSGSHLIDKALLADDARRIREALREQGYHFAEVDYRLEKEKKGWKVTFITNAGPYVCVDDIEFKGNTFFGRGELFRAIETSVLVRGIPLFKDISWLHDTAYREDTIEGDLLRITEKYRDAGFLDAKVFIEEKRFIEDFSQLALTIRILEGARYRVRSISFKGNRLFSGELLLKKVTLVKGEPLYGKKLRESAKAIKKMYDEKAYIFARVRPRRRFDRTGSDIDIVFDIEENKKIYIEKIDIRGNVKTREKVVRRELSVYPGEPYNMNEMRKSLQRLFAKGYFSRIEPRHTDGSRPDWKNVVIDVDERSTGTFIFGMTVSSDGGVAGRFILGQDNFDPADTPESFGDFFSGKAFSGGGQRLRINLFPGTKTSNYNVYYQNPYFLDMHLDFVSSLFYRTRAWSDFTEGRSGVKFSLGKRVSRDYLFALGYNLSEVAVYDIDADAPHTILASEGNTLVSSIVPRVSVRKLEVDRHTTRYGGYTASTSYELSSRLFGSETSYGKFIIHSKAYQMVLSYPSDYKHVLSLGARVFYVHPTEGDEHVPVFELGFLGGGGTLRGFRFRQVGPRENGRATGGRVMATATTEYSMPIPGGEDNFRVVLFSDAGNLAEDWDMFDFSEFRTSVGWGFRIKVGKAAFAPTLVIDFGYPVRMLHGDKRRTFYFSFASSF